MNRPRVIAAAILLVALLAPASRGDNAASAAKLFAQARNSERDKRYPDAIQAIKQAIELDASNPQYHGYLGWLGLVTDDYATGVKESAAAIALAGGKNDGFFHFIAGESAYYDQEPEKAIRHFKLALERDGGGVNAAIARARLDSLADREYEFEYRIDPKRGKGLKRPDGTFRVPIPSTSRWPFQKRTSLTVIGARAHKVLEVEGNDVVDLTPEGDEVIRVMMTVSVKAFSYKARVNERTKPGTYSDLVKPYLGASEWIDPDSRVLKKTVEPLRKGDPVQTVAEILKFLRGHLRYIPNENLQDPGDVKAETTLTRAQASCHGWSACFAALCRAAGVPARMVVVFNADESNRLGYHDIVEVYFPTSGWIPLEPQPGGVVGLTGTKVIRLHHYPPTRTWWSEDPDKMQLFCAFTRLNADGKPLYNVKKK